MLPGQFDINTPSKVKKEVFHVVETFLRQTSNNTEAFVRKFGKNDSFIYTHEVRTYKNKERVSTVYSPNEPILFSVTTLV